MNKQDDEQLYHENHNKNLTHEAVTCVNKCPAALTISLP